MWCCYFKHGGQLSWKGALEVEREDEEGRRRHGGLNGYCSTPSQMARSNYKGVWKYIFLCSQEEENGMKFSKYVALLLPHLSWLYPYEWHNRWNDQWPKTFFTSRSYWMHEMSMSLSLSLRLQRLDWRSQKVYNKKSPLLRNISQYFFLSQAFLAYYGGRVSYLPP